MQEKTNQFLAYPRDERKSRGKKYRINIFHSSPEMITIHLIIQKQAILLLTFL